MKAPLVSPAAMSDGVLTGADARKWQDVFFAFIFVAANFGAFVCQMMFIMRGNAFLEWVNCMNGQLGSYATVINTLITDGIAGMMKNGGSTVLGTAVGACFVLCGVWILLLRHFTRFVVWASYAIGIGASIAGLFYAKDKFHFQYTDTIFYFPALCIVGAVIFIIVQRDSIERAARVLKMTCVALQKSPAVFAFTATMLTLQMIYFGFYIYSSVLAYFAYGIQLNPTALGNDQCGFIDTDLLTKSVEFLSPPVDWINKAYYFTSFMFCWNLFFGDALRLFVVSGVMSHWYFDSDVRSPRAQYSSLESVTKFTKWALSMQLGTLAVASLFQACLTKLKQWAKSKGCCACCPHTLLAKLLLCTLNCVFSYFIKTMSRFLLAFAAITGDSFAKSVSGSFGVVFRQFGDAMTNELTASVVLNVGTFIFAVSVGFLAWMETAAINNLDPFTFPDFNSNFLNYFIRTVMFGFSGWVAYNTLLGLMLLSLFPGIWTATLGDQVYMGVLCMLIARLMFTYFGGMLQDATTGMFLCAAIDKDRGINSSKLQMVEGLSKEAGFELDTLPLKQQQQQYVPPQAPQQQQQQYVPQYQQQPYQQQYQQQPYQQQPYQQAQQQQQPYQQQQQPYQQQQQPYQHQQQQSQQ